MGRGRDALLLPRIYPATHSGLSFPALMREQVPAAAALSDRAAPAAPARWGLGRLPPPPAPQRSSPFPSLLSAASGGAGVRS